VEAEKKQCKQSKNNLNPLAAVIHKNKRNAAGNIGKFVHPRFQFFY